MWAVSFSLLGLVALMSDASRTVVITSARIQAVPLESISNSSLNIIATYPEPLLQGNKLFVRGNDSGLNWNSGTVMSHTAINQWTLSVRTPVQGNVLAFKILVDDKYWSGGANFLASIGATSTNPTIQVYPYFQRTHGQYVYERNVYSPQLKNTRDLVIYLPPSYFENKFKYYDNVLIMHDGQNLFNASTSFGGVAWNCQETLDGMIAAGEMEELVVVGVDNTGADRTFEYTYSKDPQYGGGGGDIYLEFLENTVIPFVTARYRVSSPSVRRWGMLGSSLGGLLSCYAGWERSSLYDRVGCMSSSFWWNNQDFNRTILSQAPFGSIDSPRVTFYLDSGTLNDDEVETLTVRHTLKYKYGYMEGTTLYYYLDVGGQHNEQFWGKRFHIPMSVLYPPTPVLVQ